MYLSCCFIYNYAYIFICIKISFYMLLLTLSELNLINTLYLSLFLFPNHSLLKTTLVHQLLDCYFLVFFFHFPIPPLIYHSYAFFICAISCLNISCSSLSLITIIAFSLICSNMPIISFFLFIGLNNFISIFSPILSFKCLSFLSILSTPGEETSKKILLFYIVCIIQ